MANLFAAAGAVSSARAAAPAQDARQRVDSVTAVALPAANRRGCWIVNRSDRAGSSKPPVPRFSDFRNPAETSRRAHFPCVRTEVVTKRSGYPSTCWCKRPFRTGHLGLAVRDGRSRSKCCEIALERIFALPSFVAAVTCRPTAAANPVSARRDCQRRSGPYDRGDPLRPCCNASRHGSPPSSRVSRPGRRTATRGPAWQPPRRSTELSPHPVRCGPTCLRRGVCLQDIAMTAVRNWIAR